MLRFLLVLLLWGLSHGVWAVTDMFTLVTEDFPPFYGKNLPEQGFLAEVVKIALKRKDYDARIEFISWNEALDKSRMGRYDALLGAYKTQERLKQFYFSLPLAKSSSVLFRRKDTHIIYDGVSTLKGYKIAVIEGYSVSETFDEATFLDKLFVKNSDEAYKLLYEKKVDLVTGTKTNDLHRLKYVLEKQMPGISKQVVAMEPALLVTALYIAVSKKARDAEKKLVDLNDALRTIFLDGTYQAIQKKHDVVID